MQDGSNFRKDIFTVPSCSAHNADKASDDEYFLYVLSTSLHINKVGRNHYNSKIRRAINRNPNLLNSFITQPTPVTAIDPLSNRIVNVIVHELDKNKVNTIIDRLSRGIYYYHYKNKWLYNVKYQAEFLFKTTDLSDKKNLLKKTITQVADEKFLNKTFYGENKEVFKYQVIEDNTLITFRLHFYDGCKILLYYKS